MQWGEEPRCIYGALAGEKNDVALYGHHVGCYVETCEHKAYKTCEHSQAPG
jgi:hypothetical protein